MSKDSNNQIDMDNIGGDDKKKIEMPTMPKPVNVHAMILNRLKKPLGDKNMAKQAPGAPTPSNVSFLLFLRYIESNFACLHMFRSNVCKCKSGSTHLRTTCSAHAARS